MIAFLFGILISVLWIAFEIWRSPTVDDDFNVIKPEKKFRDLFKKQK